METKKILIVEDEMVISAAIEEALNRIGYENIETAYNAKSATHLLNKNEYDLVLMDINLGGEGIDGIDVVADIQLKKEFPVIYITGNSDNETVQKAKTTIPHAFITKPISEIDLKIQIEIALYKEKIKIQETEESAQITNLYEGDCSGLAITLNLDGTILSISPHIKKITGKPAYCYVNKKIGVAGLEKEFYDLLNNALYQVKNSEQRIFFWNIYSPYLGNRIVKVDVVTNGGGSQKFEITDITHDMYLSSSEGEGYTEIAVVSDNQNILNGFKSITNIVKNTRVAAEMRDIDSLENFLSVKKSGMLMIDVNLEGLNEVLEKYASFNTMKKILMASPSEWNKLKKININIYDGYISKMAGDTTILELFEMMKLGKKYYDKKIRKTL